MTKIYHYHQLTKKFLGISEGRKDPRDPKRTIIPANATLVKLNLKKGQEAFWNGSDWNISDIPKPPASPKDIIVDPNFNVAENKIINGELIDRDRDDIEKDKWKVIRLRRNQSLIESDWTQLGDSPLTEAKKKKWAKYRKELRELPKKFEKADDINWPIEPK